MKTWIEKHTRNMTNNQLSNIVLAAVAILMVVSLIGPLANVLAFIAIAVATVNTTHSFAKAIDWMDDTHEYEIEIPWSYHFVYCFAFALVCGIVVGIIGSAVFSFSPEMYARINPRIVFFGFGFICSVIGYAIAWRNIPNKKGEN